MTRLSRLSRSISGSVAIVTGAASGMGRATAHLFADEGFARRRTALRRYAEPKEVAQVTRSLVHPVQYVADD